MHTLWAQTLFTLTYLCSGATSNNNSDLLKMRALSTIIINVTPSPTILNATSSVPLPPAQIATPITQPPCRVQDDLGFIPQNLSTTDGLVSPDSLLYRIRQMVCNGTCSIPQGVPSNDVAIAHTSTDYCEISVEVTNTLEAWVYSGTPPEGVEQQECWNSTQSIIERCIKNQANTGWWNGYVSLSLLAGRWDIKKSNDFELTSK